MAEKTCSRCGIAFFCSSDARGCWCENLVVDPSNLQFLRDTYDNCLCPACLALYAGPAGEKTMLKREA